VTIGLRADPDVEDTEPGGPRRGARQRRVRRTGLADLAHRRPGGAAGGRRLQILSVDSEVVAESVDRGRVTLGQEPGSRRGPPSAEGLAKATGSQAEKAFLTPREATGVVPTADDLLGLARATAADGQQRGVGATSPTELETLRDTARTLIGALPADDATRFVLPWLWRGGRTDGRALTHESEFGYELRFSRYKPVQIKP